MAATIKDIRTETGLALATISKYLNGGNVKKENREKIDAAVKKLDYRPNTFARSLVTKKTRTVSFVVNDITSQFSGILLHHAGEQLRKAGYSLMIYDSGHDEKREAENIRSSLEKQSDGILLLPVTRDPKILSPAKKEHVPVVLLDREMEKESADCVIIDNRRAAEEAVSLLISRGHQRISVIHSLEYTGYERYLGYLSALKQAGITPDKEIERMGEKHSTELGYQSMKELLALKDRPTAVLMTNYEISLGVIMALNEKGIRCPEEISLVGFDELILSLVMKPKMTLVAQPMEEIAAEGVRLLLKRIEDEVHAAPPQRISLSARLVEGESIRSI